METLGCSLIEVLVGPFDVWIDMIAAKASTMRRSEFKDDSPPPDTHPVHTPGMMRLHAKLGN